MLALVSAGSALNHTAAVFPSTAEAGAGNGKHTQELTEINICIVNFLRQTGDDGGWILSYISLPDQFFAFILNK